MSEDEEEEHNVNESETKSEDQLAEMLDNLSSATYEKSYKEALEYYKIMKEMLNSELYGPLLKKREIKSTIE
jgi:hypothetical protein